MPSIRPFALERFFARYEFTARYLLSCSDCEALTLAELLELADEEMRERWERLAFGYTETCGHPLLREAVAGLYSGLEAEDTLVLAPEEGIFLLMHALLEPGDHVVCTMPGYQSLHEVARSIGCEVSGWMPEEAHGWRFDPARLEALLRDETRLVVVNFPHNPTGAMPTPEEWAAIVKLVDSNGARLFSDEMYRYLELGDREPLPSAPELAGKAICLSGLSKSFGLPGLRIGWLATRDREVLEQVSMLRDYTTICNSAPAEILAVIALRARALVLARLRSLVQRNLEVLDRLIAERPDRLAWTRPQGGSVGLARLVGVDDTYALCEQLVQETGIMLAPSRLFDFGDHHVRLGFGRADLPEVAERFAAYLR